MKIMSMRVQKFRSVDDATLRFDQVTAIVGANNSGKSHFLRALNAFFNYDQEKEFFKNKDHKYSSKSNPRITVCFSDIPSSIPVEYLDRSILTISAIYRWDRNRPQYEVILPTNKITIDQDKFEEIVSNFRFIYIPISRDYKKSFSIENGIVYDFLKEIFKRQVERRDTIQPVIDSIHRKLKDTVLKTAIKKTKSFYPFSHENEFELQIPKENAFDCIINGVSLFLKEYSTTNDIRNCGSGIQSAVYLAMSLAASVDNCLNYLVGIEEPELNMHPQAQRELMDALKDQLKYPHAQFVITTHSSVMIDTLGHEAIALCRKCKGKTRDVVSNLTQVRTDFLTYYQLEEYKYYSFFDFKNSDFFFSKHLVIAESPIDCNVFIFLLKKYGLDPNKYDITFIPAQGETNAKYPYALATELKIPFLCIVDKDVFLYYENEKREKSLDDNGFPIYKSELKRNAFWTQYFSDSERKSILSYLTNNRYKKLVELLLPKKIITMKYSLEVDLVDKADLCQNFYNVCDVPLLERSSKNLLTQRHKSIKKFSVLKDVLNNVDRIQLPYSYKKIIKAIEDMVTKTEAR